MDISVNVNQVLAYMEEAILVGTLEVQKDFCPRHKDNRLGNDAKKDRKYERGEARDKARRLTYRKSAVTLYETIQDAIHGTDPIIQFHEQGFETVAENIEHTVTDNTIIIGQDGQIASASFGIEPTESETVETIGKVLIPAADINAAEQRMPKWQKPLYI